MTEIKIKDDYIKLEQALKLTGEFSMGSDAKYAIRDGLGKKLRAGDVFTFENHDYCIVGA